MHSFSNEDMALAKSPAVFQKAETKDDPTMEFFGQRWNRHGIDAHENVGTLWLFVT